MKFKQVNEDSLSIEFSDHIDIKTHQRVKFYYHCCSVYEHVLSVVPSYNTLLIHYDIRKTSAEQLEEQMRHETYIEGQDTAAVIVIPVCYETFGVDLAYVAEYHHLTTDQVIKLHTSTIYPVYMIGFTPGFPYLGGLDERLATPRLTTPRTTVAKGSVGIGGEQTGIYPIQSPGGWQIIGRTPVELFDAKNNTTLLKMGDYIQFKAISHEEYEAITSDIVNGLYEIEVTSC